MLFRETVAVYCENNTEHTDTLCGRNAEFFNVKSCGMHSYHWYSCFQLWAMAEHASVKRRDIEAGQSGHRAAFTMIRTTRTQFCLRHDRVDSIPCPYAEAQRIRNLAHKKKTRGLSGVSSVPRGKLWYGTLKLATTAFHLILPNLWRRQFYNYKLHTNKLYS
jgi:hypothetical protein